MIGSKRKETEKMGEVAFTVASGEIMTEPWIWGWGYRETVQRTPGSSSCLQA